MAIISHSERKIKPNSVRTYESDMNELVFARNSQFDLAKIFDCGQCFRFERTDEREGTCSFEGVAYDRYLYGSQTDSTVTVRYSGKRDDAFVFRYFDLETDYAAIARSFMTDPVLARASKVARGIRILRQDAWEMLVTFIISQRKNIPAIQACVETLCTRYGAPLLQPGGNVLYAFPTAQALAAAGEQALRDCTLGYRAPYVLAAAQAVAAGTLDLAALETLPDARLLEALMQQHGVGIKVANCVALFAYGRMECAPVDVWIQRVIDQHYAGQNPFPAYGNAGILQQWMFYFARSEKERVK